MKIEFTRAEVEAILLDHVEQLTGQMFNTVEAGGYRTMPDTFTVSTKEEEDAAQ
jgi:hypothetical protein